MSEVIAFLMALLMLVLLVKINTCPYQGSTCGVPANELDFPL